MKKNTYIKSARQVINLEIKALEKLKKSLNNSFNVAVNQIIKCQSKVILCGVGKSGLIANKIAATLSSVAHLLFICQQATLHMVILEVYQKKIF